MVTDLGEVFRLGTSKAEENLAFRRHLAAHHIGERPFQILASGIQQHMDCTTCANCCRHSVVTVHKEEMERIAEYLGVTAEAMAQTYTDPDPEAPAARILRSTPDGCTFLKGNLCTIYEVRPKACEDFPHVGVGNHSLGARRESLARWAPLCPIVYNALEAFKHLTGYHPREAA